MPVNNGGRNGNRRRNILLASILVLAILSLFVVLSNPGLFVPSDDNNDDKRVVEATSDTGENDKNQTSPNDQGLASAINDISSTESTPLDNGNGSDNGGASNTNNGGSYSNNNGDMMTTPPVDPRNIPTPAATNNTHHHHHSNQDDESTDTGGENSNDAGVNHAPVANNITITIDEKKNNEENNSVMINLSSNVTDQDIDDTLAISVLTQPAHGNLVNNEDGTVTYSPDLYYSGTDSFDYKANDQTADSNSATVSITVDHVININMDDRTYVSGIELYSGRQIEAEYVTTDSSLVGKQIDTIVLKLAKRGSPTGIAEIGIFNADLSVKQLFDTLDVSIIHSSYVAPQEYTFTLPHSEEIYTIQSGDRIGIKFVDGTLDDCVIVKVDNDPSGPFDGQNSYRTFYTTMWFNVLNGDMWMSLMDAR